LNEWPELSVDGRRRYRSRDKQTRVHLLHIMHWPPCPNLYEAIVSRRRPNQSWLHGTAVADTASPPTLYILVLLAERGNGPARPTRCVCVCSTQDFILACINVTQIIYLRVGNLSHLLSCPFEVHCMAILGVYRTYLGTHLLSVCALRWCSVAKRPADRVMFWDERYHTDHSYFVSWRSRFGGWKICGTLRLRP